MALSTSNFISELNNLIETCKDGENGFREAAQEVKNPTLKTLFLDYAKERGEYATELQQRVSSLGQAPESSGSVAASLHRRWIDFKSAVTGQSDQAIIDECERGRHCDGELSRCDRQGSSSDLKA
ncbi:MAG: PA2169 family four-helix-bundle protein [Bryobacteraceae bacterium]